MKTLIDLAESTSHLLLTLSWQAGALIVVMGALTWLLRSARPAVRHALWCVVLLRLCLPVGISSPIGIGLGRNVSAVTPTPPPPRVEAMAPVTFDEPVRSFERTIPDGLPPVAVVPQKHVVAPPPPRVESVQWSWPAALGVIWAAGVLFFAMRVLRASGKMRRALARAKDCGRSDLLELLESCSARLRVRGVRLKTLPVALTHIGPCATGLFRPTIFLPAPMVESWEPAALEPLLLHELAHIRRGDLAWQVLQLATQIAYWFHPLVWWAQARLRHERELVCDDLAVAYSSAGDGRAYSHTLVRALEESRPTPSWAMAGVGIGESRLVSRVRRLLAKSYRPALPMGTFALLGVLMAGAIGALVAADAQPSPVRDKALVVPSTRSTPAPQTTPAAALETTSPAKEKGEPRILRVRVVNEESGPIAKADIQISIPYRLNINNPVRPRPDALRPLSGTTDEKGYASFTLPDPLPGDAVIVGLAINVGHPDYCRLRVIGFHIEAEPKPLVMKRGGFVEAQISLPSGEPALGVAIQTCLPERMEDPLMPWARVPSYDNPHASRVDFFSQLFPTGGRQAEDKGILHSPRLPTGPVWVRAVAFQDDGTPLLSPVTALELKPDERRKIELKLAPGVRLEGRFDDSVPRPVKNGWVSFFIVAPEVPEEIPGHDKGSSNRLQWMGNATVAADGAFTMPSLPAGETRLIGGCDGFVCASTEWTERGYRVAQALKLEGAKVAFTMPMERSGSAEVHVRKADGTPAEGITVRFNPMVKWAERRFDFFGLQGMDTAESLRTRQGSVDWAKSRAAFSAKTDAEGIALIPNLPPGEHSYYIHDPKAPPNPAPARPDGKVLIEAGETSSGSFLLQKQRNEEEKEKIAAFLRAKMREQDRDADAIPTTPGARGELRGRVVDAEGKPLADVLVDAWDWCPGNETKTAADGTFRLGNLTPDRDVEVRFIKEGFAPFTIVRQPLGVMTSPVSLDQQTWLEGMVTGPNGQPVPKAHIRANAGPKQAEGVQISSLWTEAYADEQGRYRILLQPDKYDLQVTGPGGLAGRFAQSIGRAEKIHLDLDVPQGITFSARVVDSVSGEPVQGVELSNWQHKEVRGVSGRDGLIEITGLLPGEFDFDVKAKGYGRWWCSDCAKEWQRFQIERSGWQRNFDGLTFNLSPGLEPVTIMVERAVRIRGRVLDPEGQPVAGATAAPAHTGTGNSLTGDTRFSVKTNDDGTFEMWLPASGVHVYNLQAHDGAYQEWRRWANGEGDPMRTTPGQEINDVELRLTPPGVIRGRVVNADGQPAADREVMAQATDKRGNRYYDPTARTDREGRYELKYVAAGEHEVLVKHRSIAAPPQARWTGSVKPGEVTASVDLQTARED